MNVYSFVSRWNRFELLRGERNGLGRREKWPKKIGRKEKGRKKIGRRENQHEKGEGRMSLKKEKVT